MSWRLLLACALPVLVTGSGTAQLAEPVTAGLAETRAEWRAAEVEAKRLQAEAGKARDKAGKLAAERQAAAAGLLAAEAEISALNLELVARQKAAVIAQMRLQAKQAPAAALVAGLVNMGRRPPILAIADSGSMDELVRTRLLLDATLPAIRARTAGLSAELAEQERLVQGARKASKRLADARKALAGKQQQFAALEAEADATARALGSDALAAGDREIAARDEAGRLGEEAQSNAAARSNARALVTLGPLPTRPDRAQVAAVLREGPSFVMPSQAPLIDGMGSVNRDGVRSRGVRLATRRGEPVVSPAGGSIAFSGAFRSHDGVVIIDHGGGWVTMLVGVRGNVPKGSKVVAGDPLGTALGPISIEYSLNGRPMSAPIAAVRSLSIQEKPR